LHKDAETQRRRRTENKRRRRNRRKGGESADDTDCADFLEQQAEDEDDKLVILREVAGFMNKRIHGFCENDYDYEKRTRPIAIPIASRRREDGCLHQGFGVDYRKSGGAKCVLAG